MLSSQITDELYLVAQPVGPNTTTVVMKAHESLFCWSQWALSRS